MYFIELTRWDKKKVSINVSQITLVEIQPEEDTLTTIFLRSGNSVHVKESYTEVISLLPFKEDLKAS